MVVPPPGLLSTITVWPSLSDNGPATTRAAASDAPPGGKVTIELDRAVGPWRLRSGGAGEGEAGGHSKKLSACDHRFPQAAFVA